jgi:hypothetical protein
MTSKYYILIIVINIIIIIIELIYALKFLIQNYINLLSIKCKYCYSDE